MRLNSGSSAGKESACNAGDPGLIPWLGRSPGEGIGYPHQYSWGSMVAQMVKNPSAMWETWVQSLGWEDPLEEGMTIHSRILSWRIPRDRKAWQATVHGVAKTQTWLSDWAQHSIFTKGFPSDSVNPSASAGDSGSILELGRSPGGGNVNPLQYSHLGNPMERGAWWATVHGVKKSQTRLKMHTHITFYQKMMAEI